MQTPLNPAHPATPPAATDAGAAVYAPWVLKLYDAYVLGFSNRWIWRCPTRSVLVPFFRAHRGQQHLDVGVGSGYYLSRAGFGATDAVTLLDLNRNSLAAAQARVPALSVTAIQGDVLSPLLDLGTRRFDAISVFYLLHCLPGTLDTKLGTLTRTLLPHLSPEGVFYGATILGDEAPHNAMGRRLMQVYNQRGIFGNRADTLSALRTNLESAFGQVDIRQHGVVALFAARQPRRG